MNNFQEIILAISVYAIPVLFAISLHEVAHGLVARYFGDPTAANEGRLSLNPIRHIDPFGTILLPLVLYVLHIVPFGYAKPVPVEYDRLRNPKKQMALVAAAGPAANFIMGLAWTVFFVLLSGFGVQERFFLEMAHAGVSVNAAMLVFNLIPLPPLDGGRIVTGLLPMGLARRYARIERYSVFVFVGLIVLMQLHILDGVLQAGITAVMRLFSLLVLPLSYLVS